MSQIKFNLRLYVNAWLLNCTYIRFRHLLHRTNLKGYHIFEIIVNILLTKIALKQELRVIKYALKSLTQNNSESFKGVTSDMIHQASKIWPRFMIIRFLSYTSPIISVY
ncbi:unnamed protein product [Blepharisma stoltei]|uniref:Maturase K n=1 Tax=Blepharisma stoltei TaxID=1481888 RepID=A0AAU9IJZ1_9CILI|nr:unnamed protein product [Blepharisma stoltei]